jgi:hypothetical protein
MLQDTINNFFPYTDCKLNSVKRWDKNVFYKIVTLALIQFSDEYFVTQ